MGANKIIFSSLFFAATLFASEGTPVTIVAETAEEGNLVQVQFMGKGATELRAFRQRQVAAGKTVAFDCGAITFNGIETDACAFAIDGDGKAFAVAPFAESGLAEKGDVVAFKNVRSTNPQLVVSDAHYLNVSPSSGGSSVAGTLYYKRLPSALTNSTRAELGVLRTHRKIDEQSEGGGTFYYSAQIVLD